MRDGNRKLPDHIVMAKKIEKPVWSTDKNKSLQKRNFHSTSYKRIILKSPLKTESNRNYKKTVAETQHTLETENNRR